MVAAVRAGRTLNPRPGIVGKQRSVHNTYFTLPVLFVMISSHYPMTYGHWHAWAVLAVIGLAGVLIRRFFVLRQSGRAAPVLPALAALLLVGLAVALAPSRGVSRGAGEASFARVRAIVRERCAGCHAERPTPPGFVQAPAGVLLDTPDRIRAAADRIHQSAAVTRTMPIANLTGITEAERAALAA
ncbi:MAG: urate hydroxylase PuuD [Candidatus Rokuibacteriota bacterium]